HQVALETVAQHHTIDDTGHIAIPPRRVVEVDDQRPVGRVRQRPLDAQPHAVEVRPDRRAYQRPVDQGIAERVMASRDSRQIGAIRHITTCHKLRPFCWAEWRLEIERLAPSPTSNQLLKYEARRFRLTRIATMVMSHHSLTTSDDRCKYN